MPLDEDGDVLTCCGKCNQYVYNVLYIIFIVIGAVLIDCGAQIFLQQTFPSPLHRRPRLRHCLVLDVVLLQAPVLL